MATLAQEPVVARRVAAERAIAWLFTASVCLSAFLLFLIQPMIAKAILPWFGGSAAVWAACMLFFQTALLLGYAWSHAVSSMRYGVVLHCAAIAAAIAALPVVPSAERWAGRSGEPALIIVLLLAATVGLPFTVLSATSPLLQAWYAGRFGAAPWRLFAFSNAASLLALLAYPSVVERLLGTHVQLIAWSWMFVVTSLLIAGCGVVGRSYIAVERREGVPVGRRMLWLMLPACGSALLLASTNELCHNIASITFLWVIPLAAYLLSFVIAFESERLYVRRFWYPLVLAAFPAACAVVLHPTWTPRISVPLLSATVLALCVFCHGELAALRPRDGGGVTSFYVTVSLGGALGGMFIALIAPRIFAGYYEFPITLAVCALIGLFLNYRKRWWSDVVWTAAAIGTIMFANLCIHFLQSGNRVMVRSFYGSIRVSDGNGIRTEVNGTTVHGVQWLDAERRDLATTYYGAHSGIGRVLLDSQLPANARIGVIGLGAGTIAAWGREGDHYTFYELNPDVARLAREQFTFLADSKARVDVVLGDGRLALDRDPAVRFDVLAVDAFSGDSIPVHLMTLEALRLYESRLTERGILCMHITNTNVDLAPVLARIADALGLRAFLVHDHGDASRHLAPSWWALIPRGGTVPGAEPLMAAGDARLWTDDYSNLFETLK